VYGVVALAALKLVLKLELGPEWDSNANRAEILPPGASQQDTPISSFLLRATARGSLAWRSGRNRLRATAGVGGKVFFNSDVEDQDVLVGQLGFEDRVRATDRFELGVAGDYYDASQLNPTLPTGRLPSRRDFRAGSAVARASFLEEDGEVTVYGGYRGFQYKPDQTFDFQAGQLHALGVARLRFGPEGREVELDLGAAYHLERRFYAGLLDVNQCPPGVPFSSACLQTGDAPRADWFHEASLELTYLRELLVTVGYAVQLNLSNSFGQSLMRHVFTAKVAYRLPWQLYATLKGQLLVTRYLDPVLLDHLALSATAITIEDENRNAFIADVERPVGHGISVEARYSIYTNELTSSPVSFLRQVVYLGVSYQIGTH
jgi:hypothetical protein